MKAILEKVLAKELENINILRVIAISNCGAIGIAKKNGICFSVLDFSERNSDELMDLMAKFPLDTVYISTINRIIPREIVKKFSSRIVNLHYSLLPKYKGTIGLSGLDQAIRNNDAYTGATLHFVTDNLDDGPIISQIRFKITLDRNEMIEKLFLSGVTLLADYLAKISRK